jgi:hypothetical protein
MGTENFSLLRALMLLHWLIGQREHLVNERSGTILHLIERSSACACIVADAQAMGVLVHTQQRTRRLFEPDAETPSALE